MLKTVTFEQIKIDFNISSDITPNFFNHKTCPIFFSKIEEFYNSKIIQLLYHDIEEPFILMRIQIYTSTQKL